MRFDRLAAAAVLCLGIVITLGACSSYETADEGHGSTGSALAGSSDNDQTAFQFFVGQGLTATQAAAVVGNLDQESSMNPAATQLPSGPGRGIAQWSLNDRWAQENAFAKQDGGDELDLQTQLDFVWHELTTNANFGLAELQAATDLSSAVEIFQDKYEICGKCNASSRVTFAQRALSAFGDEAASTPPAATATDSPATDTAPSTDPASTTGVATTAGSSSTPASGSFGGDSSFEGDDDDASYGDDDDDAVVSYGDCVADGLDGACISTSACGANGGVSTAGLCPGAANIQCCTFE